jgi:membrane associated rhomboid family serine protease
LTYAFVHSGIGHWALNALWIALLGFILEPRLSKARYLILLASGIVAGALGVAVLYSTTYLLIGDASVIYALAGASAAFAWRRRPTLSKAEIVLIALVTLIAFMPPSFFYANGLAWFLGAAFGITAPPAMPDGLDSVRAA